MSSGDLPDVRHPLADQAADILDETTTAVDLCRQLDFGLYERDDPLRGAAAARPFGPMMAAIFLQALEDYSDPELHRRLQESDVADALGFDPDDIPSRSTFTRARNGRFAEFAESIERARDQIRRLAAGCGSPVGPSLSPEESSGASRRTKQRLLRRRTRDIIEEFDRTVIPALDLPRPEAPVYSEEELLNFEALLSVHGLAASDGGEAYAEHADPDCELGAEEPFYEDGPTGETLLEAIKQVRPEAISEMVNRAAERIFTRVKPYAEFKTPVQVAIDITYVGFHGDPTGMPKLEGKPGHLEREWDWCHKFATISVVGESHNFTVAMLPVGNAHYHDTDTYAGEDTKHRPGDVVRQLLDIASEYVPVRCVYADREFYGADVVSALEEHDLRYVIPARKTDRIKRFIRRREYSDRVAVKHDYALYGSVKGGTTHDRETTTLVVLPPDESNDSAQPFITNTEVDDEIGLDRRRAKQKIQRYENRAAIETSYAKISEFAPKTASRSHGIRHFHMGMAVLLYNAWLLVDFLVQVSMDVEVRSKPRVTADQFRRHLRRRLDRLI
jgi:hypothetical protein